MTFAAQQVLAQQPDSAELYTIERAGYKSYWTSYYKNVSFGGVSYRATTLERGDLANVFGPVEVTCRVLGSLSDVFLMFTEPIPVTRVSLTITKLFIASGESQILFKGNLVEYSLEGATAAALFSTTLFTLFTQKCPRVLVSGTCNNVLFDSLCKLDRDVFIVRGEITEIGTDPTTLMPYVIVENSAPNLLGEQLQIQDAAYFQEGLAQFSSFYRTIVACEDADVDGRKKLTLQYAFPSGVAVGSKLRLTPGCSKTVDVCASRFANSANFLGLYTMYLDGGISDPWRDPIYNPLLRPTGPGSGAIPTAIQGASSLPIPVIFGSGVETKGLPIFTTRRITGSFPGGPWGHWILLCWGVADLGGVKGFNETYDQTDPRRRSVDIELGIGETANDIPTQFNRGDPTTDVAPPTSISVVPLKGLCTAYIVDNVDYTNPDPDLRNVIVRRADLPFGFRDFMQELDPYYDDKHYCVFSVSRYPTSPWPTLDQVAGSYCNVVSAIYEILTDTCWGAAIPVADIDEESFAAAAQHCADRNYGIQMIIDKQTTVRQLIDQLCVIGNLMLSYTSAFKIKCVALTADAGLSPVATFLDTDWIETPALQVGTWDSTLNRFVRGQWADGTPSQLVVNEANALITGSIRTKEVTELGPMYPGQDSIYSGGAAQRTYEMMRDESFPRATLRGTTDQRFYAVGVGDCVRVTSTRYGVDTLFRVINRTLGTIDDNRISFVLQQISEAVRDTSFITPPESAVVDPDDGYSVGIESEEFLAFSAYSAASAESTNDFATLADVRVSWGDHPILRGQLITDAQDGTAYDVALTHGTGDKLIVTLASPKWDDVIQSNATGLLNVKVWSVTT